MPDIIGSSLPPASPLTGGELIFVIQGGTTRVMEVPSNPIIEQGSDTVEITGGTLVGVQLSDCLGVVQTTSVEVDADSLAAAGSVVLLSSPNGEQYRMIDIQVSGPITNFSGGSGNRNISVTDGTGTWSVLPAAELAAADNARWGSDLVPWPTGKNLDATTAAGQDLVATYSGGSLDYAAGSIIVRVVYVRVA